MKRLISWPTLEVLITVLLAFTPFSTTSAFGQATSTGTVVGVVTDQSGAFIPGTTITLTDVTTNASRTTITNNGGQYVLVNVTPGTYSISAAMAGFSTSQIGNQVVNVGTQTTANFTMTVGATNTTVEVEAMNSDLQTLNATVGDTVTQSQIDALPAISRDVSSFTSLQPGVSPGGSVAGTQNDQAVFQLDGGNNSSDMDGNQTAYTGALANNSTGVTSIGSAGSGVMPMPADSVEEFKVNTSGQTADFNNSSGMQAQIVTKRGTDHWHGTAYEYYLDSNIGANTWQNNLTHTAKPSYHYNRFGAAGGGPILSYHLGGKTFLFANYEGFRYPNSATYERTVPSAAMKMGILTYNNASYNLKQLDPRGIGISPVVAQMWNKYEPIGNDPSCGTLQGAYCDGVNGIGFKANVSLPQKSNFLVGRIDHDFGSKWHFNGSYRYYELSSANTAQVDIGGFFSGDRLGEPAALAQRPQHPFYMVMGMTTNITSSTTNEFHYSYLRNQWSYQTNNAPPQITGLGGALEPLGESSTLALVPFNVDTSSIRVREWNGKDHFFRDDLTMLKGNHLIQFGGQYQHNYNFFSRSDNGSGINFTPTYQLGDANGSGLVKLTGLTAAGFPSGSGPARQAAAVLGLVTDSQQAYARQGENLSLLPPLTQAFEKVTIPYYNTYFSDTWHMKPSLTVNYGLSWTLEMPPREATGKQVVTVDQTDEPIEALDYLAQREKAALQGAVYNPQIGFATEANVGKGNKYPFSPFYGGFSPRISAAWNPNFQAGSFLGHVFGENATVIRGGYGRVFGRINGVILVLVPLQGDGLIQSVQCRNALASGACGPENPTDTTGFRIGVDGSSAPLPTASATLPQPLYPGYNDVQSATDSLLDPHFRPNMVDSFNLTIQRQITPKILVEVGYIGRLIHNEFQALNLNTVPYMMIQGGQSFASAYAALETAMGCATSAGQCAQTTARASGKNPVYTNVEAQPFFETALKGTGYCAGYTNCTTAVMQKEAANLGGQFVFNLWSDLDNGGFNFPRTMMGTPIPGQANGANGQVGSGVTLATSTGYGNYNGGFVTFKTTNWHGLTAQENFTYSKSLGTQAAAQSAAGTSPNDSFDLNKSYGLQTFNQKFIFNTFMTYQTPWFKGQSGLLGRLAGGWTIAPIFAAGSGAPLKCTTVSGQSFGGVDNLNLHDTESCVFTSRYHGGHHVHRGVVGGTDSFGNAVGTRVAGSGTAAINMFADPAAVYSQVRAPILGIDTKNPGAGPITGLPYWNMDVSIRKNLKVRERISLEASGILTNVFNHNVFANPGFSIASGASTSFGVVNSQGNAPRQMQLGLRANFDD